MDVYTVIWKTMIKITTTRDPLLPLHFSKIALPEFLVFIVFIIRYGDGLPTESKNVWLAFKDLYFVSFCKKKKNRIFTFIDCELYFVDNLYKLQENLKKNTANWWIEFRMVKNLQKRKPDKLRLNVRHQYLYVHVWNKISRSWKDVDANDPVMFWNFTN